MSRNKAMKVGYASLCAADTVLFHLLVHLSLIYLLLRPICVARTNPLSTEYRSPGDSGLVQLAGPPRNPIVTSHYEYGVKCVVVSGSCSLACNINVIYYI